MSLRGTIFSFRFRTVVRSPSRGEKRRCTSFSYTADRISGVFVDRRSLSAELCYIAELVLFTRLDSDSRGRGFCTSFVSNFIRRSENRTRGKYSWGKIPFTNYVKILFRNVSFDRHISQDGNKSIRARCTAVLSQDSIKATRIAARRTFSYVYQNFDNTEVSEKEVAVGPRVGKEGAKGKWRKRRR